MPNTIDLPSMRGIKVVESQHCPPDKVFLISPLRVIVASGPAGTCVVAAEDERAWLQRCCVITNIGKETANE